MVLKTGDRTCSSFPCEIISEITGGNMARVFLARLLNTKHLFVIKAAEGACSKGEYVQKDVCELSRKLLKKEAGILIQLRNTCIPEVYEYVEEKNMVYYIMSYHQGETLEKHLIHHNMSEREIGAFIFKICEVLMYLHQHGIVHGDLKPSNILYNRIGGEITLIDFGMAEFMGKGTQMDRTSYFQGTLGYAAPECWHRTGLKISPATDIFAMGAILFYLLERKDPREYYGKFILSDRQKKNRWQPILDRCCALHPENRCQSTAKVFEMIKKLVC